MIILQALQGPLAILAYAATAAGAALIARNEWADWSDRKEWRRQLKEAPIPASELPPLGNFCRMCRKSTVSYRQDERDAYGEWIYHSQPCLKGQPCPEDCEHKAERHLHVECRLCGAEYAMKG